MALKAPFRKCVSCRAKLPPTDGHSLCIICLSEGHKVETCHHCMSFTKQTRKNRADRLRSILWEKALKATDAPKQKTVEKPVIPKKTITLTQQSIDDDQSSGVQTFVVSETTVAEKRMDIPITPGRSLVSSVARKISKKARTPKSAELQKRKKKRKNSNKSSSPLSSTVPTVTVSSRPVSVLRPLESISEGEIRDSTPTQSVQQEVPLCEQAAVDFEGRSQRLPPISPARSISPRPTAYRERSYSPPSDWDRQSAYTDPYRRQDWGGWEYYRPQTYLPAEDYYYRYRQPGDNQFARPPPVLRASPPGPNSATDTFSVP